MSEEVNDVMIKLELNVREVNTILTTLGKAPYEISAGIIEKIRDQSLPQVTNKE